MIQSHRTWLLVLPSVLVGLLAPRGFGQTIQTVSIADKADVTTVNYPVTLSLIFGQGDVANHVTARVDGVDVPTQTDVKVRWPDSSVKHALVSFLIPTLRAGTEAIVEIRDGGTNHNTGWMTRAQLLATDFDARMTIAVGGTPTVISARGLLAGIADPEYWIQGGICTEFLIRDFNVNINNQLNVQYYVRTYPGWNGFRVDTVVENVWSHYRGNINYDFVLDLGYASPATVFSKTAFMHNANARWHKVFWLGEEPPAIEIRHDLPYMISTGLLPKYDTGLIVPESTISSKYTTWQNKPHDIMQNGIILMSFGTTGGREEIGLYPTWSARYLIRPDNRLREIMLNCGDLSGSIPVHMRESDPTKSFYQHVLSIDDRPTVVAGDWDFEWTDPADRLPPPITSGSTGWSVDRMHQASFACIPYIITGDFWYLEEMYFWGAYNLAFTNFDARKRDKGIMTGEARAVAWSFRNIMDPASLAPDAHIEKAYFIDKTLNNINEFIATRVNAPASDYPSIRYWHAYNNSPADPDFDANIARFCQPWQDDFMVCVLAHARDIGFAAGSVLDWLGVTVVNRFSHPDYNWNRGAPYRIPTHFWTGGVATPLATWLDVNNSFVDDAGPGSLPASVGPDSYYYIARAALSHVLHLPDGPTAWNWLDIHIPSKGTLNGDPTWSFVPWLPPADTTPPAPVTDLAASDPAPTSVTLTWTAPGDDGVTGQALSYDIRYATEPITEANWQQAAACFGEPVPAAAGTVQSMIVPKLYSSTAYYFAIRTRDARLNLSALSNVVSATTAGAVTPTVQFAAFQSNGGEAESPARIPVTLSTPRDTAVTVDYAVTAGTAIGGGQDYVLDAGTLVFDPWVTSRDLVISVIDDAEIEANETIVVTLSNPTAATLGTALAHTHVIVDNDTPDMPTVEFAVAAGQGPRSASPVSVTVVLSNLYSQTVGVDYTVTGGTAVLGVDYTLPAPTRFVSALKRDLGLAAGGALASQFSALTWADVVLSSVRDSRLYNSGTGRYYNYGAGTWVSGFAGNYAILGFDLSGLAGATINKAQLRMRCSAGNSGMQWAGIKSRDWVEGTKNGTYPGAIPASPGVTVSHPAGMHPSATGPLGWGPEGKAFFDFSANGADLYDWTSFTSVPTGAAWVVADVTSLVQDWAAGTKPNYGLVVNVGTHTTALSESSPDNQPVLFVDYTLTNRLAFAPGQTSRTIDIGILPGDPEQALDLTLTLANPVNAILGEQVNYTYTIAQAPELTVDAGPDVDVYEGRTVNLHALASEPENPDLVYAWSQLAGKAVVLAGADAADASFTAPTLTAAGDSPITLGVQVSDNQDRVATDGVDVRVHMMGDVTRDGSVGEADLETFVEAFGSVVPDAGFDPFCDFQEDDAVDVLDLLMMVENWGRVLD